METRGGGSRGPRGISKITLSTESSRDISLLLPRERERERDRRKRKGGNPRQSQPVTRRRTREKSEDERHLGRNFFPNFSIRRRHYTECASPPLETRCLCELETRRCSDKPSGPRETSLLIAPVIFSTVHRRICFRDFVRHRFIGTSAGFLRTRVIFEGSKGRRDVLGDRVLTRTCKYGRKPRGSMRMHLVTTHSSKV